LYLEDVYGDEVSCIVHMPFPHALQTESLRTDIPVQLVLSEMLRKSSPPMAQIRLSHFSDIHWRSRLLTNLYFILLCDPKIILAPASVDRRSFQGNTCRGSNR